MSGSEFLYVTYIRTTPEALWAALTDVDTATRYWFGCRPESDWRVGAAWRLFLADGELRDSGEVLAIDPPRGFTLKWRNETAELGSEGWSTCRFDLEPVDGAVRLTVHHRIEREESKLIAAVSGGWPKILSNLKSLLETGEVVLRPAQS